MDVNSDFENTNKAYGQYAQSNSKTDKMEPVDNVNHPQHYQSKSGLETIDVIEAFTEDLMGSEATNTGNVLKYMCRWKSKNGLEDLKKAQWYLKRLIGIVEGREKRRSHQHVYMSTYEPKALDGSSYVFNKGEKNEIRCEAFSERGEVGPEKAHPGNSGVHEHWWYDRQHGDGV